MSFAPIQLARCFPELFGFVLFAPERLEALLGSKAHGQDLMRRFARSKLGDQVTERGIAIPIMDVEPGFYDVRIAPTGMPEADPELESSGWILGTESGQLRFGGAGYLTAWDPDHPRLERIQVPAGWYRITIRGYLPENDATDGTYEIVLEATDPEPAFEADIRQSFNLYP